MTTDERIVAALLLSDESARLADALRTRAHADVDQRDTASDAVRMYAASLRRLLDLIEGAHQ
jgi:hypothetical protein